MRVEAEPLGLDPVLVPVVALVFPHRFFSVSSETTHTHSLEVINRSVCVCVCLESLLSTVDTPEEEEPGR